MRAAVGDRIMVMGRNVGQPRRSAIILAVEGDDGAPPYMVRWDDSDHDTLFFPGADSIVEHYPAVKDAAGPGH